MDISLLPQEVYEEIVSLLNLSDILSCCLVNVGWRNAANNNRIWSRLCTTKFGIKKGSCELITSTKRVEPEFVVPENKSYKVTDICEWRVRFMQEVHISKNWRNGRYVSEGITRINVGEVVESEGNVIVVPNNERRFFTPWIIEEDIALKNTVPFSLMNMLASFFKLCCDKIVITQCTLLQVFSRTEENDFVLSYRFLFNKPSEESSNIPTFPDVTEWYKTAVGLYPCDITMCCDHDGKYFVGVILEGDLNQAVLHIWDISIGKKCKEQVLPDLNDPVIDIRFTIHNSYLILFLKVVVNDRKCTKIYCFNLKTFTYTNMLINFNYALPLVLVRDPYILTADTTGHNIFLWRISDGTLIYKMYSQHYLNPMIIQFSSSFLLLCENSTYSDTVKVFCTKALKTVHEFCTGFFVINLMLIRSNLMLIRGSREFGVWDIISGTKLHTIYEVFLCRHVVWTNNNCSKIALETESNELYLFHFW